MKKMDRMVRNSRARKAEVITRERPGITPGLLLHLLPNSAFSFACLDVEKDLPPIHDQVVIVQMEKREIETEEEYAVMEDGVLKVRTRLTTHRMRLADTADQP